MELEPLYNAVALAYQIRIGFDLLVLARLERHIRKQTFQYEPTSS